MARKLAGAIAVPIIAIAASVAAGAVFIAAIGQSPALVYGMLLKGTFGNFY